MTEKSSADTDVRLGYISENLLEIRENIASAAKASGRKPEDIRLMAVTKTVEPIYIKYAIENCGIDLIGENKVQELLLKEPLLPLENVESHLIGHLQSNKARKIAGHVSTVESVDSVELACELGKRSLAVGVVTDVLLEVNIGGEESKTGMSPDELPHTLEKISVIDGIKVRGLMAIPPICENNDDLRRFFSYMRKLFVDIGDKNIDNVYMDILSMGMSGDYKTAIEEGSNLVRIGSAIFGARTY
ncbi:MAG: YggS family pyridoxal phosphate-dependent enzyme [Clostridiales bacterium]|nr:YggS family pyridoxal phosphate-dependent enzyme [Clostridiales bacterium]